EDRHQQAADEDVVGHGQCSDHVLQHARDDHHQDAEAENVEQVTADVVVLSTGLDVAVPQPSHDVLTEHGRDHYIHIRGHESVVLSAHVEVDEGRAVG